MLLALDTQQEVDGVVHPDASPGDILEEPCVAADKDDVVQHLVISTMPDADIYSLQA